MSPIQLACITYSYLFIYLFIFLFSFCPSLYNWYSLVLTSRRSQQALLSFSMEIPDFANQLNYKNALNGAYYYDINSIDEMKRDL